MKPSPRAPSRRFVHALRAVFLALALLVSWSASRSAFASGGSHAAAEDLVDHGSGPLTVAPVPRDYAQVTRGSLRISYPPALEGRFRPAIDRAAADAQQLATQLGLASVPALEVRLVPDPDAMRALAPREAPPPAYAVGVAYPSLGLTLVSSMAPRTWEATDVRRTLRHELSHLLLEHATGHARIPRWFSEGVAVHQANEHSFERFRTLAAASFTGGLLPLRRLDEGFSGSQDQVDAAYAQSADFIDYLLRTFGEPRFGVLLHQLHEGRSLDEAARETYRRGVNEIELDWKSDVKGRFLTAPLWAGSGTLWMLGTLLLGAAWVRRKRRSREVLDRWAAEDVARERVMRELFILLPGYTARGDAAESTPAPRTDVLDRRFYVIPASASADAQSPADHRAGPVDAPTPEETAPTTAHERPRLVLIQGGRNLLN